MRAALRTDENPALDVAVEIANHLQRPLLVYQGLTERYPYASDRHHTFVLQAARVVQQSFEQKQIRYALHVERDGHRGPHLKTLAMQASVVVTEDMPTEPLRKWTLALSREANVLAVDTACVVPMRVIGKAYDRAFAFRSATQKHYDERLLRLPTEHVLHSRALPTFALPFDPVDLQHESIDHVVSQCQIDHSIGPVPDSEGGSIAGYRRWEHFQRKGLGQYAARRNNPLVDGVSRLSAYLHYGMVSPMRIAREAAALGSAGATKFLDELLIWRELAYAFCFYRPDHGLLTAIPNWARDTLSQHESAPRAAIMSWERLAQGCTGDSLWDAAQKSLLIHGELHNNVRMTWGKAFLNWTTNAKQALQSMIDLNHRYALDGRDPASYGGLLWCLGQFDRPFTPPNQVVGTVRTRSTDEHARRLDVAAYRNKVLRPLSDRMPSVAVIGAGMSGLVCARTLSNHGFQVRVFEKSRGVSGRMSTRRQVEGLEFDHGAQYFTARDSRFKRYVKSWEQDGLVRAWDGRIVVLDSGTIQSKSTSQNRYVAVPGMNALGKHLAHGLDVRVQTSVKHLRRDDGKWRLEGEQQADLGAFDAAVVAIPADQAVALLSESADLAQQAASVKLQGCWTVMLAFDQTLALDFDGAFVHNSPVSWIACNSSKPGRAALPETWVAHASPTWTREHMETDAETVQSALHDAFWNAVGRSPVTSGVVTVHRWRYAIPQQPLTANCLWDRESRLGACGDWCAGPRVEGAFLSGSAMAGRIMQLVEPTRSGVNHETIATGPQQLELF